MENVVTQITTGAVVREKTWTRWLALGSTIIISFAAVMIPAFLILPFKSQTERALRMSYLLRSWSPMLTITTGLLALALVVWLWPRTLSWWRKALLVIALLLAIPPTWFARQNHFEWMFNPLRNSAYAKASEASFVGDSDMVLAVKIRNEAVAYPVRLMAYHHVVQDVVGGTPICATY
jgi:TRAP-type uncharacterized transport system fused permease subunit